MTTNKSDELKDFLKSIEKIFLTEKIISIPIYPKAIKSLKINSLFARED